MHIQCKSNYDICFNFLEACPRVRRDCSWYLIIDSFMLYIKAPQFYEIQRAVVFVNVCIEPIGAHLQPSFFWYMIMTVPTIFCPCTRGCSQEDVGLIWIMVLSLWVMGQIMVKTIGLWGTHGVRTGAKQDISGWSVVSTHLLESVELLCYHLTP